ncbi:HupE/UreJ family protein [Microvirga sp. BT688]|nr:HupE/UreJ family protein [Microvirga sp.]
MMLVGGVIVFMGIEIPAAEVGIFLSVVILGVALSARIR